MKNNQLLIGIQFTDKKEDSKYYHYNLELYVLRDIALYQLLEGIQYGLKKRISEDAKNRQIYEKCQEIYTKCMEKKAQEYDGRQYFTHMTFTSFNNAIAKKYVKEGERTAFYLDNLKKPICELGFITSSRIIFDATGTFPPKGKLDISNIIKPFHPEHSDKIVFPKYNISTRQLYKFDDTAVNIIQPTDPPKKAENNLFFMIFPSLLTMIILIVARTSFMGENDTSGSTMIVLSVAMGITTTLITYFTWRRQKIGYEKQLKEWRNQYQDYMDALFEKIQNRQMKDVQKLDDLYPDMLSLINADSKGIYALNEHLYSRAPQDMDFLTFRVGISDYVESVFEIKGNSKDVIFSDTLFDVVKDKSGRERLRIFLRNELKKQEREKKDNLCELPSLISERYKYLKGAPLLYSLKNKSALGIVDSNIDSDMAFSKYFISRMIFELCYYHSPEDLQFVMFFNEKDSWSEIEHTMNMYKFMPHFRGLFSDKSQFVFDSNSANLVLSSLLTIMGKRKENLSTNTGANTLPHIVLIVYEDYGMKEHAFAEYLPKVPMYTEAVSNNIGLTFVFATKFKEYLPAYCDDIACFDNGNMCITPHDDRKAEKKFLYPHITSENQKEHYIDFITKITYAFRFFSSIYYAQIAQNGKVPSTVSAFEIFHCNDMNMQEVIKKNWGISGKRPISDVTKSLQVPIGKTENGIAYLDLHEKGDGPHMLVAGTTGSGKTETIITFLLGLCMQYRPDELNLLLVDMKGGGFTKRIGHLPHVVGTVTDVDGDENGTGAEYMLGRFLFAMKAEIKRRKLLFNKLYVDNIDAYITACKDIEAHIVQKKLSGEEAEEVREIAKDKKLSHLILVVDEFTELKRFSSESGDLDFISEITTIARIGRSLGFHIILISQNIEGAITEDIRVNSRARLCLKVATKQASKDMIGTELAASSYMPGNGRAYLLVGTGSKFEYFQSGYSGAGIKEDIPIEITLASKYGAYTTFYRSDKDNTNFLEKRKELKKQGLSKTQLEAITEAICEVYQQFHFIAPHMVFCPPLPTCIAMDKNGKVIELHKKKGEN